MTAGDGQRGWGLDTSSVEKMLEFGTVDCVCRRKRAASSQPWPDPSPVAVSPARSYAHSRHLLFWHEPAPGLVGDTGQGLKCLSGSLHPV